MKPFLRNLYKAWAHALTKGPQPWRGAVTKCNRPIWSWAKINKNPSNKKKRNCILSTHGCFPSSHLKCVSGNPISWPPLVCVAIVSLRSLSRIHGNRVDCFHLHVDFKLLNVAVRFDRHRRMPEVMFSWRCFVSLCLYRNNKGTGHEHSARNGLSGRCSCPRRPQNRLLYLSEWVEHW